ncbi:class I SAM-dependent methyltransferase [Pseudomonas sp. Pseusp122]|uniref:class I SAM-dependent methyltransferase n=1 Tax=unclassified Pseudomonas TaxID=196821 RepID=UPI0039A47EE5
MAISYGVKMSFFDFWRGLARGHFFIHRRLRRHLNEQKKNWPKGKQYTQGYYYQGLEEIGITGAKPTGFRFRQYDVDSLLDNAEVLDIGSNCGFVAAYCARRAKSVLGVELNPYLNKIAVDTARYLKRTNVRIVQGDFTQYQPEQKFDVVLSFSNHHTIDGNLNMGFENYIRKIALCLKPGGYLLFESHNVYGPGSGAEGDDGDMEEKMRIMNQWFTIERYRMVNCFLEHMVYDVNKLFIVARLSEQPEPVSFSLPEAIKRFHY